MIQFLFIYSGGGEDKVRKLQVLVARDISFLSINICNKLDYQIDQKKNCVG